MIKLGIIGDPIERSRSPALHSWVLQHLGIAGEYRAYCVRGDDLENFLETHRELVGFNVTIPHKESIVRHLDGLSHEAYLIGAVNTVKSEHKRLVGYNTDSIGFLRTLQTRDLFPKQAIILGAGGAARAVAYALLQIGTSSLTIFNRTPSRAWQLTHDLRQHFQESAISVESDPCVLMDALCHADLVVNATPAPMPIVLPQRLSSGALVYDLTYNPLKSDFLKEAERRGAQICNGLDMLIYQALESLKIWLGRSDLENAMEIEGLKKFLEELL